MTKDEPHPFKRLVPGHPYCVEGLRPWESGISCGRYKDDPIHQAEHDRIRKEAFAAVRVSANTPADPTKCCAAETTEGVTVHERDCPRFTPEAVAYRRARRAEAQRLMSQPLTPAEARTGISDRAAAALATARAQAITEDTRRLVVTVAKNAESSTTLAIIERLRDRAHAEALAEDDARSVAEGRKLLGWDETPEERERRMTAEFIEAMNTPAEARRAAALADEIAALRAEIHAVVSGLVLGVLPTEQDMLARLDRIEQTMHASGAALERAVDGNGDPWWIHTCGRVDLGEGDVPPRPCRCAKAGPWRELVVAGGAA